MAGLAELAQILRGDAPDCWTAFIALSERTEPAALDLLLAQCQSSDPHRRRAAIDAIGASPLGRTALTTVRKLLNDPIEPVQHAAIEAAAKLRDSGSHSVIRDLLKSRSVYTRGAAMRALDQLWQDGDFDAVFRVATTDRDERARKQASFVLIGHVPPAWRRLVEFWQDSAVPRERAWACDLIERFGDASDRALAERFLKDSDGHVRDAAGRALITLELRAPRSASG